MANWDIGLETHAKTALVLNFRLRLGENTAGDVGKPHRMPMPSIPATTRAYRDFRPTAPVIGRLEAWGGFRFPNGHRLAWVSTVAVPEVYGTGVLLWRCVQRSRKTARRGYSFVNPGLLNCHWPGVGVFQSRRHRRHVCLAGRQGRLGQNRSIFDGPITGPKD